MMFRRALVSASSSVSSPGVDEALGERLVLGELERDAIADEVGTAVTHLREEQVRSMNARRRERRAHPAHLGMLARVCVDLRVGMLDGLAHAQRELLRAVVRVVAPDLGAR